MLTVNDADALCDLLATRGTYFLGRVWVTVPAEGRIFMRVAIKSVLRDLKETVKCIWFGVGKQIDFFSCNHRFAEVLAPSSVLLGPVVIGCSFPSLLSEKPLH